MPGAIVSQCGHWLPESCVSQTNRKRLARVERFRCHRWTVAAMREQGSSWMSRDDSGTTQFDSEQPCNTLFLPRHSKTPQRSLRSRDCEILRQKTVSYRKCRVWCDPAELAQEALPVPGDRQLHFQKRQFAPTLWYLDHTEVQGPSQQLMNGPGPGPVRPSKNESPSCICQLPHSGIPHSGISFMYV